jgi:prepilin-type N-terminal cleavage/methylation domain-containing protein
VPEAGYSLPELLVVTALIGTVSAVAIPGLLAGIDESRAIGAARYVATRLQQARMEAVARSADVGIRFVEEAGTFSYTTYVDGNGNGVRTADILRAIDPPIRPAERLRDLFSGVDFGVLPALPAVESGGAPPGGDPVKFGAANILTFTPAGTSSSGSLYVLGRKGAQYVVRIFGETGKTRVLKFDPRARRWKPL